MSKLIVNEIEKYDAGQLTITTGTNVSIGSDLTVGGALSATLSTAAQTNITSVGTLSSLAVSGNLTVDTDTLFVDAVNNRVGIGTSSPSHQVEIASTVPTLAFKRTNNTSGNAEIFSVGSTGVENGKIILGSGTDQAIKFFLATDEKMSIDSNGNVSIGNAASFGNLRVGHTGDNTNALVIGDGATPANDTGIYMRSDTLAVISVGSGGELSFRQGGGNGTERMKINSGGNLAFPNGGGIYFGASSGSGSTSELLDDYEEGTWTPVFTGSGGNPTYTASVGGHYTKIGRAVNFTLDMNIGTYSGGSGGLRISLPFTVGSYGFQQATIYVSGVNYLADYLTAEPNVGNTFLSIIRVNDNTAADGLLVGAVSGGDIIRITGTYFV